jgi:hypothetical protein
MNNQHLNGNSLSENSQIELRLVAQDNELQSINEILQAILVDSSKSSDNQKYQEQLLLIQHALVNIDSNNKQANTLHQEFQADIQQSLDAIKQENQDLRAYCQQIKQRLVNQDAVIKNHFSLKMLFFQYCLTMVLAITATVIGLRFFPPSIDSMLPSKNDPELQKKPLDKPLKAPRKSK